MKYEYESTDLINLENKYGYESTDLINLENK